MLLEDSYLNLAEQISSVAQSRGDSGHYGMVMLSDSSAVTDSTGRALPASEKNETIENTLANKIGKTSARISQLDAKFAGLKYPIELGENYVMNCADFSVPGIYHISSLTESPSGNAPEINSGDYNIISLSSNFWFQILIMLSPRINAHMYIGKFWNGVFSGWSVVNVDKI